MGDGEAQAKNQGVPLSSQDPSYLQGLQMDPPALSSCALWSPPGVWTL